MMEGPTPAIPDTTRRLLRAMPPERTLRWLLKVLGGFEVVDAEPMRGGSSSAMHRVTLRRSSGATQVVVLRRYVLDEAVTEDPEIVDHEATALRLAASAGVATPELLAADPRGRDSDAPTVVMSWLPGRPRREPAARRSYLAEIIDAMIAIAAVDLPPGLSVRPIDRYRQTSYDPPRWTTRPKLWERAVEVFHGPMPTADIGFVHRDFHPGNLLWTKRHLTGVIDWQAACIGPTSIDPGHCRLNMLYYDPPLAEELRRGWEQRSGKSYDPWADVMSIVGVLDSLRTPKSLSKRLSAIEDTLARAVADLAG